MAKIIRPVPVRRARKASNARTSKRWIPISSFCRRPFYPFLQGEQNSVRKQEASPSKTSVQRTNTSKKLSGAEDFQEMMRIQTEFMQAQMKVFGEQGKTCRSNRESSCERCEDSKILMYDLMTCFMSPTWVTNSIVRSHETLQKLVRRGYWLDMNDRTLVMVMANGIGSHLTNDEKRAHLTV